MNTFDHNGDLWIEVDAHSVWNASVQVENMSYAKDCGNGTWTAATKMNLTQYIRSLNSK